MTGSRKSVSTTEFIELFPDEEAATAWFEGMRWPVEGRRECPRCASAETKAVKGRKPMPYWCSACRSYFSVRVGSVMESSKLPLRTWAIALSLLSTTSVSSLKLARELGVTQKTAWTLAHKVRKHWNTLWPLRGEVEAACAGGTERGRVEVVKACGDVLGAAGEAANDSPLVAVRTVAAC